METTRLSNFDRAIGIVTAVNSYKSRKINEEVLLQQFKSNRHLTDLKRQLDEANQINKQILASQLRAEENKEAQKYYKALSFSLFETTETIAKIEDQMVQCYVLKNYYDKIKFGVVEANNYLEELVDKSFNKQTVDKLTSIKIHTDSKSAEFKSSVLSKIDAYLEDYRASEARVLAIAKPAFLMEAPARKRIDVSRTFCIIVLGILILFFSLAALGTIVGPNSDGLLLPCFLVAVLAIPFSMFLRKEIRWRKEYDQFRQNEFIRLHNDAKIEKELLHEHELRIKKEKENLLSHQFCAAMTEINEIHPTFEQSVSELLEINSSFDKKMKL